MSQLRRPLETAPGPECYCGSELKSVTLPRDLADLAERAYIWVHVESGDTLCYPGTGETATGEPVDL